MVSFLFWNLNQYQYRESPCSLARRVANLAGKHRVDVFMLAECNEPEQVLLALNQDSADYHAVDTRCSRLHIFCRFPDRFIRPIEPAILPTQLSRRVAIRRLSLPGLTDILLVVVHMPSKLYRSNYDQGAIYRDLAKAIGAAEQMAQHTRTVVIGDLNRHPFDESIIAADGLHAVSSRKVANRGECTVNGQAYRFFYNPMWGLLGDVASEPPGTYYYDNGMASYFWCMLDQVLIRPDLIPIFDKDALMILASDGEQSLLTQTGLPDKAHASDHLPLLFRLQL